MLNVLVLCCWKLSFRQIVGDSIVRNFIHTLDQYSNWIIGAILIGGCFLYFNQSQSVGRKINPSTDSEFQGIIEKEMRPVLVKFGATWCPPCRSTDVALAKYEDTSSGEVKVIVVDVDASPKLSQQYRVSSIPHLFLFHNGKVVDDRVGGMDVQEIQGWLRSNEKHWVP